MCRWSLAWKFERWRKENLQYRLSVVVTNSKHTWTTHRYERNVCVCRCCGLPCLRHKSAMEADTAVLRCMCVVYVNVDATLGMVYVVVPMKLICM